MMMKLLILVTEDGIDICCNKEHLLNAHVPISVTDGIDISDNDEHPLKSQSLIDFKKEGASNVTFDKDVHSLNANVSIEVTEVGIVILLNNEHVENEFIPIFFTEGGIEMLFNEEHL